MAETTEQPTAIEFFIKVDPSTHFWTVLTGAGWLQTKWYETAEFRAVASWLREQHGGRNIVVRRVQ
jgi:hypothetical protein